MYMAIRVSHDVREVLRVLGDVIVPDIVQYSLSRLDAPTLFTRYVISVK